MIFDLTAESREEASFSQFLSFGSSGPILKNVEIFRVGDYRAKGKGLWTERDLDEMVSNFQTMKENGEHVPPIKSTHENDNRGLPLLGFVEGLQRMGDKLVADFRLVSDHVKELFKAQAFRFRSAELHSKDRPWVRHDGSRLGNVLRAVAMVPVPEVKGLSDIAFSYAQEEDPGVVINYMEDAMTQEEKTAQEAAAAAAESTTEETTPETPATEASPETTETPETPAAETTPDATATDATPETPETLSADPAPETQATEAAPAQMAEGDDMAAKMKKAAELLAAGKIKEALDLLKGAGYGFPQMGSVLPATGFSDDAIQSRLSNVSLDDLRLLALETEKKAITAAFAETDSWIQSQLQAGKMTPAQSESARVLAGPMASAFSFSSKGDGDTETIQPVSALFRNFVEAGGASVHLSEVAPSNGPDGGQGKAVHELSADLVEKEVERINSGISQK